MIKSIGTASPAAQQLTDDVTALYGAWKTANEVLKGLSDTFHHSDLFTPQEQHQYDRAQDEAAFANANQLLTTLNGVNTIIPTTTKGFRDYVLNLEATAAAGGAAGDAAKAQLAILYLLVPQILDYNKALDDQSKVITQSVGSTARRCAGSQRSRSATRSGTTPTIATTACSTWRSTDRRCASWSAIRAGRAATSFTSSRRRP